MRFNLSQTVLDGKATREVRENLFFVRSVIVQSAIRGSYRFRNPHNSKTFSENLKYEKVLNLSDSGKGAIFPSSHAPKKGAGSSSKCQCPTEFPWKEILTETSTICPFVSFVATVPCQAVPTRVTSELVGTVLSHDVKLKAKKMPKNRVSKELVLVVIILSLILL